MTSNTWYTVARTSDNECIGRVTFSIGSSTLLFDVLIQFGNISLAIVSATVQQSVVFQIRLRSGGGFIYVDLKSNTTIDSTPSYSVSNVLNSLSTVPWAEAVEGAQICLISTDANNQEPGETYVTIDNVEVINAKKYFSQGLAFGDTLSSRTMALGNGGVYLDGQKIVTADVLNSYITTGSYNSNTKKIELKHGSTVVAQIDATAFIKDGMVDTVSVSDGYLVITFNTDSGKEDISIPVTSFFDASNYYTKTQADNRYLTSVPVASSDTLGGIKVGSNLSIDENGVLSATGGGGGGGGSTAWSDITSKPSTLSGYGITDAKISSGTITLGSNTITPLTSFTETDPTVSSWAKAASKPSYNFSEIGSTPTSLSGYGITDATAKTEAIPFIVGPNTDTTAGTWTGTYSGITAYADGLTIIYVPAVAGASTTKLNINGLGAKTCYYNGTSKLSTQYAAGTPILLTYIGGYWRRADYDSNTNTLVRVYRQTSGYNDDYPILVSRTKTIGTAGTDASYTAVYGVIGDTKIPTINPSTGEVKADKFTGSVAWSNVTSKPTTISGYGITDAKIASGTITLGCDTITPLTSFTETDPTVPSWAKADSKPTYTASEVGALPDDTAIPANTSDLNNDSGFITSSDIPSDVSAFNNDAGYLTSYTETDPTVPSWAKASSKPSYTFSEIGSKPTTISGYGITDAKISSGTITLGSDSITPLTSFTETDPTVPSWAKASSKPSYTFSEIGSKPTTLSGYGITDAKISSGTITLGSDSITPLTSFTETDPTVPSWAKASSKPSYTFSEIGSKPTSLSGYGITDAKIESGTITLGSNTITPLTSTDLSLDTSGESKKSFFSRTLPSGMTGNKGMIMSIYGKSVVLNQLAQNGDFSDSTNGWSRKSTSDSWSVSGGEITITKGQMTAGAVFYSTSVGTVNTSHKYYIAASMKSNTSGQSMMMGFMTAAGAFSGNTSLDTTSTSYVRLSGIVQPKNSSDRFSLREGGANSPTGISGSAKNVVCINLTKMFGSGNEPTLADFEAMFPLDYYAYNTGQLLSLAATGVQTGSSTLTLPLTTAASGGNTVFPNGLMSVNGVADEMTSTIAIVRVGSRTYTSGDENDSTLLTDKTTTIYALATPQVYVLDSKVDLVFDYTAGTTQAVLPAHSSSPSSTPLTCDVMYGGRLALAFGELNNKIDKMITM